MLTAEGGGVGGGGGEGVLASGLRRGIGENGFDVKDVPRPEIKCRQYLSSREKRSHVLSTPVFPTPGMMRQRLRTMNILFLSITPPRRILWLHHSVRSLVGIWSSELCSF